MEAEYIFICFIIISVNAVQGSSLQESNEESSKSFPVVDALIRRLEHERWRPDDETCLRTTLDMLRGVKNNTLWATWMWDSMQPPVGTFYGVRHHLGNYDQCLQAPWSSRERGLPGLQAQYCIADVKSARVEQTRDIANPFESAAEYYRTPTKDRYFNEFFFGVCLPAACSPSAVARIFQHMHQLTHLPDGAVHVDPKNCQRAGELTEYPRGFYFFWTVVGLLFVTAVFSTLYNKDDTRHTSLAMMTNYFCLKRNLNSLFKVNGDEIKVMNGMRFLTAALLVSVHEGFFIMLFPIVNGLDVDKTLRSTMGLTMMHLEIVVDTFFAMSGLLLIRGLVLGRQKNILFTLVKRYIRLIGPFALCTLYITSTAIMFTSSGPLWERMIRDETDVCADHWWRNLIMINTDVEKLCHGVTWYMSCDFQLAILATLLFWLFRRNRKLGVSAFVAIAVGLSLNLGWLVYSKKLDILPFASKYFFKPRKATALNDTYLSAHSRAGAYMVGMVMGYIVTAYRPSDHRNVISKKWSYIITVASLATMGTMLSIGAIFTGRPYHPLEAAAAVVINRVAWAAAVCCLIGVCEYGSVPLVTNILGWPGFAPLSKLSYGLYLLHPFIIWQQKYSARTPVTYHIYAMIVNAQGVLVLACAASFIMYLILEAPLINISNTLFAEKSIASNQNRNCAFPQRHGGVGSNRDISFQKEDRGITKAKIL